MQYVLNISEINLNSQYISGFLAYEVKNSIAHFAKI